VIENDSSRVRRKRSGERWSIIHRVVHVSLDLPKSTLFDRLYFGPYRVLAIAIFTRARVWQSLTSAHRKPGRGSPQIF